MQGSSSVRHTKLTSQLWGKQPTEKKNKVKNKWNGSAHWCSNACKLFQSNFKMLCNAFIMRLTANKFSWILKHNVAISFIPFIFLIFCRLGLYTLHTRSFFYHTKAVLTRREHQNNTPTIAVGHHHIGTLTNSVCLHLITNYKSYIIAYTYSQHMFETVL